ncbi:hypothetical protein CBF34_07225 [Vagococcus penaei]|uniref:hypothetical protein n=1 Tax=Vagococcus penaei TaxID=633807 RepID=UPI000F8695C7|nr:hypothetical protein [Vagococcus penaei]RSU01440.1 hypothetical protein CBF34_07225 [Vagococcus penaei]
MFKFLKNKSKLDADFYKQEKKHIIFAEDNRNIMKQELKEIEKFDADFDDQWKLIQKREQ